MNEHYKPYVNMKRGTELIAKRDINDKIKCGERLTYVAICPGCGGVVVQEHVENHIPPDALHVPGEPVPGAEPAVTPVAADMIEVDRVLHALTRFATVPMFQAHGGMITADMISNEFKAMLEDMGLREKWIQRMEKQWGK